MSWAPNDLVSDVDLQDYESDIMSYGQSTWIGKRTRAIEDWLFPIVKGHGFNPQQFRTRYEVDAAQAFTASAYADVSGATKDSTADDLNLATLFATVGTDALYLGSTEPFRGVFVRMLDTVSSASSVLSVAYYNGNWQNVLIVDGTSLTAGKTFSGSGSVTWLLPFDWLPRLVNGLGPYYWVKLTVSTTPAGARAGQLGVIRSSALRAPAALKTLSLIYREAVTASGSGPWSEKATFYASEADAALQRALVIVGGEFDSLDSSDLVSPAEAEQTTAQVGGQWTLERA